MEPGAVIFAIISSVILSPACAYAIVTNLLAQTNKVGDSKAGFKKYVDYTDYRLHIIRQRKMSQRAMEKEIKKITTLKQ